MIMATKPDYSRYKSIDLLCMVSGATEPEKTRIWAELGKRAHATDNITGAISNNGPKERKR